MVLVLSTAGLQVPAIPSLEVAGSVKVPPLQIGAIGSKLGVACVPTVTVSVAVVAHSPAAGVKV